MAWGGMAQQSQPSPGRQNAASGGLDKLDVESLHVQGNVWMLVAGPFNAAVQVGDEGVLVVDTMVEPVAEKLLAEIKRLAGDKPIRYIVNTHAHPDHIGGNEKVALAGRSIVAGNFAGQVGPDAANSATIFAHENTLNRMSQAGGPEGGNGEQKIPFKALPTDTFFDEEKDLFFNGEGIQLVHIPNAHTDGDIMVYFRKSDVVVAGDLFMTTTYPIIATQQGGTLNGIVAALNRILDITIPKDKQEGGTYVIPGHGRLSDEADVVDYRDMVTIIRDRIQDSITKGMSLDKVKAARLTRDYDPRWGATTGFWTTDAFVEAAYKSLSPSTAKGK
jgi:glyoxylase-like metal-dependent hydrolase (beta-lactamase superfamily II)